MSDQLKLKPCPFCGSKASQPPPRSGSEYVVRCRECFARASMYPVRARAIAAWNRRANGWMPIHSLDMAERCLVLVVTFDGEIGIGQYLSNEWQLHWFGDGERNEMDVTHWQPLPEPPKENE